MAAGIAFVELNYCSDVWDILFYNSRGAVPLTKGRWFHIQLSVSLSWLHVSLAPRIMFTSLSEPVTFWVSAGSMITDDMKLLNEIT